MSYKYEPKSGVRLVELKVPGVDELVVIKEGGSYESDTELLEYPADALKVTKTEKAEPKSKTKSSETEEEGGES